MISVISSCAIKTFALWCLSDGNVLVHAFKDGKIFQQSGPLYLCGNAETGMGWYNSTQPCHKDITLCSCEGIDDNQ